MHVIRVIYTPSHPLERYVFGIEFGDPSELVDDLMGGRGHVYLAVERDKEIGAMRVVVDGATAEILSLVVLPEYRNKGATRALFASAIEDFKADGVETVIALMATKVLPLIPYDYEVTATENYYGVASSWILIKAVGLFENPPKSKSV